jgi:hypothetical protein
MGLKAIAFGTGQTLTMLISFPANRFGPPPPLSV